MSTNLPCDRTWRRGRQWRWKSSAGTALHPATPAAWPEPHTPRRGRHRMQSANWTATESRGKARSGPPFVPCSPRCKNRRGPVERNWELHPTSLISSKTDSMSLCARANNLIFREKFEEKVPYFLFAIIANLFSWHWKLWIRFHWDKMWQSSS